MDKKSLRKQIMTLRSQFPIDERIQAENMVFDFVTQLPEFHTAKTISSFVSFGDEISMMRINSYILSLNKTLVLPYIDSQTKTMLFYKVEILSELIQNTFGILEPNPAMHMLVDYKTIDCVLTPGVAFDAHGYRLGYGGGFYDRFFSQIEKTIPKIGIAFELQRVATLPVESYDYPIHKLITEKGILSF